MQTRRCDIRNVYHIATSYWEKLGTLTCPPNDRRVLRILEPSLKKNCDASPSRPLSIDGWRQALALLAAR